MKFSTIFLLSFPIIPILWMVFQKIPSWDNQKLTKVFSIGVVSYLLAGGVMFASHFSATDDIEIWNGELISKNRIHDSYTESYSCNCSTDSRGNTTCQTCLENHYTVEWNFDTTIGKLKIKEEDSTSDSVYRLPNPSEYEMFSKGDPVSKQHHYTNYIQAVPDSLFHKFSNVESFKDILPPYPDQIFNAAMSNHFLSPGFNINPIPWNKDLTNMLKTLGPQKQVNVIVVIAKTNDQNYVNALQTKWEGANKNDVVLVIGSDDGVNINFADVISWTKVELFKIQLRDDVFNLGTIQEDKIVSLLNKHISNTFERRKMKEFEYLSNEIEVPVWMLVLFVVLVCASAVVIRFK